MTTTLRSGPVRIRLSRAKGFDLQKHSLAINGRTAINVARPGPWGNPFVVGNDGTRAECVDLHRKLLAGYIRLGISSSLEATTGSQLRAREYAETNIASLRGHNLACWCSLDGPCHADTLLLLAAKCEEIKP